MADIDKDEENYIRAVLLLTKGCRYTALEVLRTAIINLKNQTGKDFDTVLREARTRLRKKTDYKQRQMLFPEDGSNTQIDNWDISLIAIVILKCYNSSLTQEEIEAIKTIRHQRNEVLAHSSDASLQTDEYDYVCSELENAINILAGRLDKSVRQTCEERVQKSLNGNLQTAKHDVKTIQDYDNLCKDLRKKIEKLEKKNKELESHTKRMIEEKRDKGFKKPQVVDTELEINSPKSDRHAVYETEQILTGVIDQSIRGVDSDASNCKIRMAVDDILKEIEQDGIRVISVIQACIILRVECTSYYQSLQLLKFTEDAKFQNLLNKLADALARLKTNLEHPLELAFRISKKSVDDLLAYLRDEDAEAKRTIRMVVQCKSVAGLVNLWNSFEKDKESSRTEQLQKAISERLGSEISIKLSMNPEQVLKALHDTDEDDEELTLFLLRQLPFFTGDPSERFGEHGNIADIDCKEDDFAGSSTCRSLTKADVSFSDTEEVTDDKDDNSHESGVLSDENYKKWVKAAEGLVLLQRGLAPFVDREIHNKHALFLKKLPPPCVQATSVCGCTFQNVLPNHAINLCRLRNCLCNGGGRRKCPNQGYCSTFCQLILNEHRTGNPLWKHSNMHAWPTDHWSIGKCYQTTPTPSNSAHTTDASGLLSVIINGKFFQNKVASPLGHSGDVFLKAREMCNDIMRRAKMELTDAELQDILTTCIAVLKDPISLLHDRDAVSAVKHLESLRNDELKVNTEEEIRLLHDRKEALRQMIQEEDSKGIHKLKEEETEKKEALRQMIGDETVKSMQEVEEARSEAVKSVDQKMNQVLDELRKLNEEIMQKVLETGSGTLDAIDERKIEVIHDLTTLIEEMQRIKEVGSGAVESVDERLNKIVDKLGIFSKETIKTIQRSGSAATESVDTKIKNVTEDLRKIINEAISNKRDAAAVQRQVDELGDRLRNTEAKIQIILSYKEKRNVGGGPSETKQETLCQELSDKDDEEMTLFLLQQLPFFTGGPSERCREHGNIADIDCNEDDFAGYSTCRSLTVADVSGPDTEEAAGKEADDEFDDLNLRGLLKNHSSKNNWMKGAEALVILQKGLVTFVDREIFNKHSLLLKKLSSFNQGTSGCHCTFKNILPDHAPSLCNLPNCFCKEKGKRRRKCPNQGYCSTLCQLILNEHRTGNPLWKNSNINAWPTDHWSIAKCYMTTPTSSHSAQTTDAAGLLSVILLGKFFQSKVASSLGQPGDVFLKARDVCNYILHRAKMELTDVELQDILSTCIAVLKDPGSLLHDRDAVLAVKHLESLRNDQLKITAEEEIRLLYDRKEARRQMIKEETANGIQNVKEEETNRNEALRQMIDEETIKDTQKVEEVRLKAVKSVEGKLEKVLDELRRLNDETVHKVQKTGSGTLESIDDRKNKVMDDLRTFKGEMMQRIKEVGLGAVESVDEKLHKIVDELSMVREETILTIPRSGSAATKTLETKIKKVTENLRKIIDETVSNKTDATALQRQGCNVEESHVGGGTPDAKQEAFNQKLSVIRQDLAKHLLKHYTTTSITPLITMENFVRIDDVYTEANMEIEKKTTEQDKDKRRIKLNHYRDIFESEGTPLKRIYVVGEVGTGKTAFCQLLINKWCKFILEDSKADSEVMQMMKQFDFVFYLPLRSLQTNGNLKEMIKWYYKNEVSKEMVDYILSELPEKCLILADGLDEWKPSPGEERPIHVTDGIPDAEDMKDVMLITTSRPSALGILNMKSTEYDRKIILSGIKAHVVHIMAERYCAKLDSAEKGVVLQRLKDLQFKDIEKMPLVLKQIVWMLGKRFSIAPGISGLYSGIVKIAVQRAYEKYKEEICAFKPNSRFSKLKLPEQLMRAPFIEECQTLVLSLGEIAFEMLASDSDLTFGLSKLRKYGIVDDQMEALLGVGLFSEDNCDNSMEGDTQFCFPHNSFIEYFSAVFIASHVQSHSSLADRAGNHQGSTNILSKLFEKCEVFRDVLPMNFVLKIVCGLAPDLTQFVCQKIYSIAQSCDGGFRQEIYLLGHPNLSEALSVQCLIADCVTECKECSRSVILQVPIFDLIVCDDSYLKIQEYIEGQSVQSLLVDEETYRSPHESHILSDSVFFVECSNFKHLETVYFFWLSDQQTIILQNLQMTGLKTIILRGQLIPDLLKERPCETLQKICLQGITLHSDSEVLNLLNFISHTTTLREIKILQLECLECDVTGSHALDLSQNDRLNTLTLSSCDIHITGINQTNLEHVTLKRCCRECVSLIIRDSPKLKYLLTEFATIEPEMYPKYYYKLRTYATAFTKEINEDICTCTELQCLTLDFAQIEDDALQLHSGMENLSRIVLNKVSMSESTFIKFVDSLLTLRESVEVTVRLSQEYESEQHKCESYIRNNPEKFKTDRIPLFTFSSQHSFPRFADMPFKFKTIK